jgi:preprotein translocase subunit YajC
MMLGLPLQAAPPQAAPQPPLAFLTSWLVPMAVIVVIYYFLLVAPARKKQKKVQEMLDSLKNGDRVITSGGILGTIVRANQGEDIVRLRIASSVEIDLARSAISGLSPDAPQAGS